MRGEQSHMLDTKGSRGEMSNSKLDSHYYTSPAQRSEEGVSTSLFMSPDSQNYKFADVAKMNATIAKESERLRIAH